MGTLSLSGAAPTPAISEQPLAAVALVDDAGALRRATALFLDCCGAAESFLAHYKDDIEAVAGGERDQATAKLDGTTLDIVAVTDSADVRHALLTIARPAEQAGAETPGRLLAGAIDGSPAVVWLKDLKRHYLRVNGKYVEQLKTPAERVCGKTDGELAPGESIEGVRLRDGHDPAREPLEFEYTVDAADGRPAFAVLRFALRDAAGKPTALCGVAAPLTRAHLARSECARLMRLEGWSRSDESAVRAELIAEWGLAQVGEPASRPPASDERPEPQPQAAGESDVDQFAAMAAELDAALATSARLDQELAEERRQAMVLRESSVLAARRAQEMFRTVTAERAKIAELEESVARAEGQSNELRGELAAKEDALERLRAAASEAPTPDQLEAERAQAHEAKLAAEQAQAEAASTAAALAKERRVAEALRVELRAAEEEAGRARRAASEAVAQAPTQDELEQERRRADRANANLASARARAELAEAEAKSSLAQARAELRRTHEEAAATAEALNAEKQRGATLRGELAEARSEAAALADKVSELEQTAADAAQSSGALTAEQRTVERLRRELSAARKELEGAKRTAAEKPALEDLERERVRAEQAEAAAEQVRREASGLAAKVAELELELERARQEQRQSADVPAPATSVPAELERERTRADQAEAALSEQRTAAERAAAGAEKANRKAAAATAAADAERQAAEALRVELDSVRAELEQARLVQAGSDAPAPAEDSVPTAIEDAVPTAIEEAARAEDLPRWAPDSQRALAAALATATEWRVAIKQAVKIIGSEGNWDAVVALSPDQRQPFMKCLAMWNREEKKSNAFETRAWQHRHKLPAGTAAPQPQALVALDATDDPVLKAAASEGMGSAALVPITDGTQLLGMLQLFSAHDEPPAPQVMVSLEAVALQLAGVARLLNSANTPHWHYGRL